MGTLDFIGETCACAAGMVFHPRRFRLGDSLLAFQRAAYDGLAVVSGVGFLLGVILAFQCAAALKMFGVEIYVSDMLAIALFRELGPVVTAIILAGRTGSAFAAEIGTMKANEELNALTTMGLPPPPLTIFHELAGLVGGALVLSTMGIPTQVFWQHVTATSTAFMIVFGLAKGVLFGLVVGLIGCCAGMRAPTTSDGVGAAATAAVVWSIVAIAVGDGLIAVLAWIWGV